MALILGSTDPSVGHTKKVGAFENKNVMFGAKFYGCKGHSLLIFKLQTTDRKYFLLHDYLKAIHRFLIKIYLVNYTQADNYFRVFSANSRY